MQGVIRQGNNIALNPGAVGVPLYSNGKSQFMILHQNASEWTHEFISLDYDRKQVIQELHDSDLFDTAPYWTTITEQLLLTGKISHGSVLAHAMTLCEQETGSSKWYAVPDKYWKQAINELLP